VSRVPLPLVILLCIAVVGIIWWHGTKNYDFLTPPSPTEIEFARQRAAGELAQPADLFAIEAATEEEIVEVTPPKPPPEPRAPVPVIEVGDLSGPPQLDAWTKEADKPTASFINLASKLEADTQFAWALIAWERVIDQTNPSDDEREVALNGIRRIRATLPPWNDDPKAATPLILSVDAPGDRLQLTTRAASEAAETIEKASSGLLSISSVVRKGRATAASPKLKVSLAAKETKEPPSVETPAPESAEDIEKEILSSVFKLVGSKLALRADLKSIPSPSSAEPSPESREFLITRLAWQKFAESSTSP